ncbi:MAG: metal ABC transporter solute-binding protein, Zn/Mn family [Halothiobacillaceae bacterium]
MNALRSLLALLVLLFIALPGQADEPLKVVATTTIAADLIRDLGGNRVEVTSLMGPGIDPHDYRATQGDIRRLRKADLIVYHGLNLEARLTRALEEIGREKPVIVLSDAVPPDEIIEVDGEPDPHVWMSPRSWMHVVRATEKDLAELLPEHAFQIEGNRIRILTQLTAMDQDLRSQFGVIPRPERVLVTAHDAFNYLARDYDMDVVGLQGISSASEVGLKDIQRVRDLVIERGIRAIFLESSVSPRAIEALQEGLRESGHEVTIGGELYSDSLGPIDTPAEHYIGMMQHNARIITNALRADPLEQAPSETVELP